MFGQKDGKIILLQELLGEPISTREELEAQDLATRHRAKRICPFNNKVPNCTKDKANDPLGTCTIFDGDDLVITCPIRFRQNWIIADDAADFFFPKGSLAGPRSKCLTHWASWYTVCYCIL